MPYIKIVQRRRLDPAINELVARLRMEANQGPVDGCVNYSVTRLMLALFGNEKGPYSYSDIARAVGCLECAKLEYYRRQAVPYEDGKLKENQDVYQ